MSIVVGFPLFECQLFQGEGSGDFLNYSVLSRLWWIFDVFYAEDFLALSRVGTGMFLAAI